MTTLGVVHNNVDASTSIGKLASWAVRVALEAGYEVVVAAERLDPGLEPHVRWCPLYVPPRVFAAQWAVARPTVRAALRGVKVDVLHVYQPQLARIADTWHVEYLTRAALSSTPPRSRGRGLRAAAQHQQTVAVGQMEDAYLRRFVSRGGARALFCSEFLQRQFIDLYGQPADYAVLHNPALDLVTDPGPGQEPGDGWRLGYLGGLDQRKGYAELLDAVAEIPEATLVMAGPGSAGFTDARLGARLEVLGHLSDAGTLLDQIDVLVVPSHFDPFAMVVAEAAARGVPSIMAPGVGAARLATDAGAGLVWAGGAEPLREAVRTIHLNRTAFVAGTDALVRALAPELLAAQLLEHWRR